MDTVGMVVRLIKGLNGACVSGASLNLLQGSSEAIGVDFSWRLGGL